MTWYRAHNASIVAGYLEHEELCAAELPVERFFMNVALSRVLYAHALVASPKLALGRMRAVSRVLGDPRWRAPTCSCPCTTSCRTGIRSSASP